LSRHTYAVGFAQLLARSRDSEFSFQLARLANMDESNKEDIKRLNDALCDQKTIEQLSSSGMAAKIKREELERERKAREAAKEAQGSKDGK
jgi:hypothetical protein